MTKWSAGVPTLVITTSVRLIRNRCDPGGPSCPSTSEAVPEILASPGQRVGSSSGSAVLLCRAIRASRRRSRARRAPAIIPNARPSSAKATSVPLIRGDPSFRSVAMVWCLWAVKRSRTLRAKSGSAAANMFQVLMEQSWHEREHRFGPPPRGTRELCLAMSSHFTVVTGSSDISRRMRIIRPDPGVRRRSSPEKRSPGRLPRHA